MSSISESIRIVCETPEQTMELGRRIGLLSVSGTVVSLQGSLGSGKTVIAKGIAQALDITEAIVSPTFTLVQEYEGTMTLRHMDLYRLEDSEELESIGGEELLYAPGITVIEWSEKIEHLLPKQTIRVTIEILANQNRQISIRGLAL